MGRLMATGLGANMNILIFDDSADSRMLLKSHLTAAGLDCQDSEPPQGVSLDLVRLPNVVAMPHSASKTLTARENMSRLAAAMIVDCLQGREPEFVVNRDVLDKLDLEPR